MKVVVVTGAAGFLGRHAVEALLARGYRVHGLSRRPPVSPSCSWHRADLFETGAVSRVLEQVRPTHLLHLAWETEHGRYWSSPANLWWVEATLALGRLFQGAGGRRFVGAGTCAEYTWDEAMLAGGRPIGEHRTPRAPGSFYGVAKNAAFEVLQAYAQSAGLGFAWGRLFFPYGPGDRRPTLIPEVVSALQQGRPAPCTHGRQQRDFIDVRDAAAAFVALLDSEVQGPVNIGTGVGSEVAQVVSRVGALLGRPELIRLGALSPRPGEPARLVADIARLRDEVGFVPKIGLPEGLRDTVDWLLAEDARESQA